MKVILYVIVVYRDTPDETETMALWSGNDEVEMWKQWAEFKKEEYAEDMELVAISPDNVEKIIEV